jgi:glucose-1-phosphate adenylyltransferase
VQLEHWREAVTQSEGVVMAMSSGKELSQHTLALILAGGSGTRLKSLTRWQCKPAIPFAGHFRNIDFTLSNCVNSDVRRIGVLTQYKAQTLIGHITNGWNILPRQCGEFIEVWPAQQRRDCSWYAGTADAVHQNLDLILAQGAKYTLILAGDHVYKMDYRPLLRQHATSGADVTIACLPIPVEEASAFGVIRIDENRRVRSFIEKPSPASLSISGGSVLASMGIYVFSTSYLIECLARDARAPASTHDFGRDILPTAVRDGRAGAWLFTDAAGRPGYWRDVGTPRAYWQAHMDLLQDEPPVDPFDSKWPIWTQPVQLPPARIFATTRQPGLITNSLLSAGSVVRGATINRTVLGPGVEVGMHTVMDECVVLPGARIGANCKLKRMIIGSDVTVPAGTIMDGDMAGDIALLTTDSMNDEAHRTARPMAACT